MRYQFLPSRVKSLSSGSILSVATTATIALLSKSTSAFTSNSNGHISKNKRIQNDMIRTLSRRSFGMTSNNDKLSWSTRMMMSTTTPINGEKEIKDTTTQIIEEESQSQYDDLMDHFMFELGNDITFLPTQTDVSSYIDMNFDTILFDCDGVLYRSGDAIPNASESLQSLIRGTDDGGMGKHCLFVTNNSAASRSGLKEKLEKILNLPDGILKEEQMVCSSYMAAQYLVQAFAEDNKKEDGEEQQQQQQRNVHVIGTSGLCDELEQVGFRVTGGPNPSPESSSSSFSMSRDELASYTFEHEEGPTETIDAIVIGLDTEFNYRKLAIATVLLQHHPNAKLIATNEDAYDLVGNDARHLPGNGALVRSIEAASPINKAINVGKPSKILTDLLKSEHNLDVGRTLMVGDRLDTDVKFAKSCGMKSALVMTGCTTCEKVMSVGVGTEEEPLPNLIFPNMGMMGRPSK